MLHGCRVACLLAKVELSIGFTLRYFLREALHFSFAVFNIIHDLIKCIVTYIGLLASRQNVSDSINEL